MSRLVNPGLGDVLDRLSILSLKILHGEFAKKDVTHWKVERSQLQPQVNARSNGAWFQFALDLAAVNSALWHAEDEMRVIRADEPTPESQPGTMMRAGVVAIRIQELNDQRAALVGAINDLAGDNRGSEK